jgi:hypothetical protein
MRFLKYFSKLLLFMAVLLFFIENSAILSQSVQFQFDLFIPGRILFLPALPLYFILILAFGLGAASTILHFAWGRWRSVLAMREAKSKIRKLEKEITAHRQLALNPDELMREKNSTPTDGE